MKDTIPAVQAIQTAIVRKMTGEQRLAAACEMSDLARELLLARLRQEHPEWSGVQLNRELLRLALLPNDLPPSLKWPQSNS